MVSLGKKQFLSVEEYSTFELLEILQYQATKKIYNPMTKAIFKELKVRFYSKKGLEYFEGEKKRKNITPE